MFGFLFMAAVLQMALLPGLLVLHLVRANSLPPIAKYSLATMLSIVVNYGLCLTLILLNLFTQGVILTIVALETILLTVIYYKNIKKHLNIEKHVSFKTSSDVLYKLVYILALAVITWLVVKFTIDPNKYTRNIFVYDNIDYWDSYVFTYWDDIESWNGWALSLFNSYIPHDTSGGYPIAIPAWWAVGYKILNLPFEPLPKIVSGLWLPLTLPLLLIEYGYIKRQLGLMLSGLIITVLWFKTTYMFSGLVDIPLATIGFTALFLLVESAKNTNKPLLIISAILSLTVPIIKANGFFIVVAFVVGFYLIYPLSVKEKLKYSLFYLMMLIAIVMTWYSWWLYNMSMGRTYSNFSIVTEKIYNGKSELERAVIGFKDLFKTTNHWLGWLIMLSFFSKGKANKFLAYFGLAYLIYWACYISYSSRNSFLAWPFLVVSGMLVLENIVKIIYSCYKEPILAEQIRQKYAIKSKIVIRILLAMAMLAFIGLSVFYPKKRVVNKFNNLLLERGGKVTKALDVIFKNDPSPKKILSSNNATKHRGAYSEWSKYFVVDWNIHDYSQFDYIIWNNNRPRKWANLIKTEVIVKDRNLTLYKVIK